MTTRPKRMWRAMRLPKDQAPGSKPFHTEEDAIAEATQWMLDQGPDSQSHAIVMSIDDDADPVPSEHRFTWAPEDKVLLMTSTAVMSKRREDAELRATLATLSSPERRSWPTTMTVVGAAPGANLQVPIGTVLRHADEDRVGRTVQETAQHFGTDAAGVFNMVAAGQLETGRKQDGSIVVYELP